MGYDLFPIVWSYNVRYIDVVENSLIKYFFVFYARVDLSSKWDFF